MPDKLEINQVPDHIVRAFVAKYGKIGQPLDETDWLELFGSWYAGWRTAEEVAKENERKCSTGIIP